MGYEKPPGQPSICANFHYVTIGDFIKASSHQFDFVDTNNDTSNIFLDGKDNCYNGSINDAIAEPVARRPHPSSGTKSAQRRSNYPPPYRT